MAVSLFDAQRHRQILWTALVLLIGISIYVLHPFLIPLIMGGIFALALLPWQNWWVHRFHVRVSIAAGLFISGFTIFILTPLMFVGFKLVHYLLQNPQFISNTMAFENIVAAKTTAVAEIFKLGLDPVSLRNSVLVAGTSLRNVLSNFARETVTHLPAYGLQFIVMLMMMFVTMTTYKRWLVLALEFAGASRVCVTQMHAILVEVCHDVVIVHVITGIVQAFVVAGGALAFTDVDPVLIFVFTFVVSFIPVLGAGPMCVALSGLEFSQHHTAGGFALLALAVTVGISDNILRVSLLSERKLGHPFLNLVACFGGIYIWGLLGLFIGPMVVSFASRAVPMLLLEIRKASVRLRYPSILRGPSAAHDHSTLHGNEPTSPSGSLPVVGRFAPP